MYVIPMYFQAYFLNSHNSSIFVKSKIWGGESKMLRQNLRN